MAPVVHLREQAQHGGSARGADHRDVQHAVAWVRVGADRHATAERRRVGHRVQGAAVFGSLPIDGDGEPAVAQARHGEKSGHCVATRTFGEAQPVRPDVDIHTESAGHVERHPPVTVGADGVDGPRRPQGPGRGLLDAGAEQAEGPGEVVAGAHRHDSQDGAGPGHSLDGQVHRSVAAHGDEPLGAGGHRGPGRGGRLLRGGPADVNRRVAGPLDHPANGRSGRGGTAPAAPGADQEMDLGHGTRSSTQTLRRRSRSAGALQPQEASAVGHDGLAGDVAGAAGCQEHRHRSDVGGGVA